jgi:hypothetical protein
MRRDLNDHKGGRMFGRGSVGKLATTMLMALVALAMIGVASAGAAISGATGPTGSPFELEPGIASGQVYQPRLLGVDAEDGSDFIGSWSLNHEQLVIQKFSSSGVLEGTAKVASSPASGSLTRPYFRGIAVDPSDHRFYLLRCNPQLEAESILVFSTVPNATGELVQPTGEEELSVGSEPLPVPVDIEVDPHAAAGGGHDLLILAEATAPDNGGVVQRIGDDGTVGARYLLPEPPSTFFPPRGMAISKEGTIYVLEGSANLRAAAFELPSGATEFQPVEGFEAAGRTEGWFKSGPYQGGVDQEGSGDLITGGNAIALSPDGKTLYWPEVLEGKVSNSTQAGSVLIRGFSFEDQASRVIYGGGPAGQRCRIETNGSPLAVIGEGAAERLLVLDKGPEVEEIPPAYGLALREFGSGGSGCPGPAVAIKQLPGATTGVAVNLEAEVEVPTGITVEEFLWKGTGPAGGEFEAPGTGASGSLSHQFSVPGTYTLHLMAKFAAPTEEEMGLGVEPSPALIEFGKAIAARAVTLTVGEPGAAPTVTGVAPAEGSTAGGTSVTITGTGFTGASCPVAVKFDTTAATSCSVVDDTHITATAPAHAAGKVHVTVTNGGQTSTASAADEFEYKTVAPVTPTVTGVAPAEGSTAGGTSVTITGTGFTGASCPVAVKFDTTAATSCSVVDDTHITATAPAHAAGKVHVTVTNGGQTSTASAADEFDYVTPAVVKHKLTITSGGTGTGAVKCNSGSCEPEYLAGTKVTLTGVPASGSTFAGWSGGGCSGTSTCVVEINADTTVIANFASSGDGGGGGGGGGTTTNPPSSGSPGTSNPGTTNPGTGKAPSSGVKTPAQKLAEKRQKAIAKCKKLKGQAKAKCLQKAHQIGKPKKKSKPKKKKTAAREFTRVLGRADW